MVHSIKKTILILLLLLTVVLSSSYTYSSSQYIKLHPNSSSQNVKLFQEFFKALKIYNGEIDGKYKSLKPDIIQFQIKNNIVKSEKSDGAGYVGPKTYSFFTKKYGDKFTQAYNVIFKVEDIDVGEQRYFIVSAYYSPLPGQKRYATGSYSRDIRLNGQGTHGASGVAVHPGFIAAPSNYNYGTKIELEGLGVGTVEDRGGAIVRAGTRGYEHDRLDIWMGYGDAGLTRALNWGKRTVKGRIMPISAKNTIEYSGSKENKIEHLAIKISPESNSADIKVMQEFFKEANIYQGIIDGKYSSFKSSIISFQVKNKVIQTELSIGNGYIGNKTIAKLEENYPEVFLTSRRKTQIEVEKKKKEIIKEPDSRFEVTVSSNVKKKYNITSGDKKQVDKIKVLLEKALEKKYGDNNLGLKTQKLKLNKRILTIIEKVKKESTKEKLRYLYDLLTQK